MSVRIGGSGLVAPGCSPSPVPSTALHAVGLLPIVLPNAEAFCRPGDRADGSRRAAAPRPPPWFGLLRPLAPAEGVAVVARIRWQRDGARGRCRGDLVFAGDDPCVDSLSELAIVVAGLVVMLAVDLLLLRHSLGPLQRLARLMSEVDPQRPGLRAENLEYAGSEVIVVAEAFNGMLDRLETERRASTRRALGAQEDERRWVARELHDEVGQTLTAVALTAARAAKQGGAQAEAMGEIAASLQQSLIEVRRMARRLRPEALDDLGLVNAMISMCRRIGDHGALQVDVDFATDLPRLGAETDLVIYRVAQEALTNARRHAQASTVKISLARQADRVVLRIDDDGRGFDEPIGESTGLPACVSGRL